MKFKEMPNDTKELISKEYFALEEPAQKSNHLSWQEKDTQPVKIDLNKKLDPKQETIQTFDTDAQN